MFPALNRRARKRGVELVEVDLRWGVTQSQAEEGPALEICLQEIGRRKRYFIGMLSDSASSLTPPARPLLAAAPSLLEKRQWLAGKIGQSSDTELEIGQGLKEMAGDASDGRAFFCCRDASSSNPEADGSELGWRPGPAEWWTFPGPLPLRSRGWADHHPRLRRLKKRGGLNGTSTFAITRKNEPAIPLKGESPLELQLCQIAKCAITWP